MRYRFSVLLGLLAFLSLLLVSDPARAQSALVGRPMTPVPGVRWKHTETFDAPKTAETSVAWEQNSTLAYWYAYNDSRRSPGFITRSFGDESEAGLYAFGIHGEGGDGAVGVITRGTESPSRDGTYYLAYLLTNNTAAPINRVSVDFFSEQWRQTRVPMTVEFSYLIKDAFSGTVSEFTSGGVRYTAYDFTAGTTGKPEALNGQAHQQIFPGPNPYVEGPIPGIEIPAGHSIMLRWKFNVTAVGEPSPAVGLEDVTVIAEYIPPPALVETTTGLTVTPGSGAGSYGQTFNLRSATTTLAGAPPARGSVDFFVDDGLVGTFDVDSKGQATTNIVLPAGDHKLEAQYYDGEIYDESSEVIDPFVVAKATPTVTVTPASATATVGRSITFTAEAANPYSTASPVVAPSGTFTWNVPGCKAGSTCETSKLPVGTSMVTATFTPDTANYLSAAGSATVRIDRLDTSTTLTITPDSGNFYGTTFTISTTTTTVPGGAAVDRGVISLGIDGRETTIGVDSNGVASTTEVLTATTPQTLHVITARYIDKTGLYNRSTAVPIRNFVVNKTTPRVTAVPSKSTFIYGDSITFMTTATNPYNAALPPSGTFTWTGAGNCTVGPCTTTQIPVGAPGIGVSFTPDAASANNFNAAIATPRLSVTRAEIAATVRSSVTGAAKPGDTITFTANATNKSHPNGGLLPTGGTVRFYREAVGGARTQLGTDQPLDDGTAKVSVLGRTVGLGTTKVVAEILSTDGNYATTPVEASLTQSVASDTDVAVTSPPTSIYRENVTFTAQVTSKEPGDVVTNGEVTFTVTGGAPLTGKGTVNASGIASATFTGPTLNVGTYSVTAVYAPLASASYHVGSTSSPFTHVRAKAATTAALALASPQELGEATELTATFSSATAGAPPNCVACVTFRDGADVLGAADLVGGVATLTRAAPGLAVGSHSITAAYAGSANYAAITSAPAPVVIDRATSIVTPTMNTAPAELVYGGTFSFGVVVTNAIPGEPTGTITVRSGTLTSAPIKLVSGAATVTDAAFSALLPAGGTVITIDYSGDGDHKPGSENLGFTINKAPTTVDFTSSPNPSVTGQGVVLAGTVTAQLRGTPTGAIDFGIGGASLGTVATTNASAALTVTMLPVGANDLTSSYSGDANFLPSARSTRHTVSLGSTRTAVLPSANPVAPGTAVTFGVSVTAIGDSAGTPTGSVTILDNGAPLGVATLGVGQGFVQTAGFSAGSHTITAQYSGNGRFAASTSAPVVLVVNAAATKFELTATPSSPVFGTAVTVTATLTSPLGSAPTGDVTFRNEKTGAVLGTQALAGGTATISVSSLSPGTNVITASYAGDSKHLAGTASTALIIRPRATTITLAQSSSESKPDTTVTFTARVAADGFPVDGSVVFRDNGVAIGESVALVDGVATRTLSLTVGTHTITASFTGSAGFSPSTSFNLTHTTSATPGPDAGPTETPPSPSPGGGTVGGGEGASSSSSSSSGSAGIGAINIGTPSGGDDGCSTTGAPLTAGGAFLAGVAALLVTRRRRRR